MTTTRHPLPPRSVRPSVGRSDGRWRHAFATVAAADAASCTAGPPGRFSSLVHVIIIPAVHNIIHRKVENNNNNITRNPLPPRRRVGRRSSALEGDGPTEPANNRFLHPPPPPPPGQGGRRGQTHARTGIRKEQVSRRPRLLRRAGPGELRARWGPVDVGTAAATTTTCTASLGPPARSPARQYLRRVCSVHG